MSSCLRLLAPLGLGLLAACAGGAPEPGDVRQADQLPFESQGDLRFFVDLVGYRGSDGLTDQEIYLSITNDEIGFDEITEGALYRGELRLLVRVTDPETEAEVFALETSLKPEAASRLDSEDRGIIQVIRERAKLPPGLNRFEVILVDEKTLKTGLLNKMRNKKREGHLVALHDVPDLSDDRLSLSEPALLRGYEHVESSAFGRNGVDFDPNPSRLYGLTLSRVGVYVEVYAGASFEPGDTLLVRTQLLDRTEVPLQERVRRAAPSREMFVVTDAIPLGRDVSAGSYLLDVTVRNKRTAEQVNTRRPFEVIWAARSWTEDPESVLTEMRLIMSDSDFKTLEKLAPGAREVFLAQWWKDIDPTPETEHNEAREAFLARIRKADAEFASTLQRGIVTDRGRVYVRYGPPDEVDFQYSSSSIGEDLGAERVAGPGERASLGSRPNRSFLDAEEFQEGDVSDVVGQRGGANVESKALEIWYYDGQGYVITGERDLDSTSHRGLKFIFADEMGDGNYTLIGSSGTTLY